MPILWSSDKTDVASLLDGDYRATLAVLSAFEQHVVNHHGEIPRIVYQRLIEAIADTISALRDAECEHCESVGLEVKGWDVLCPACAEKEKA